MAVVSYIFQAAFWLILLALCLGSILAVIYLTGAVILQVGAWSRRTRRG